MYDDLIRVLSRESRHGWPNDAGLSAWIVKIDGISAGCVWT